MIYGMESRAIVYSDYIDEMKEALDKEQSSAARRLLDLAPTPWYYFDTRGYAAEHRILPRHQDVTAPPRSIRMFWDSEHGEIAANQMLLSYRAICEFLKFTLPTQWAPWFPTRVFL
ncbi:hypothetical protein BZA77DRAFT_291870 [Pyronema omphalodes]|nr:hypothetical protein BZA77DRAFT_291870 [Pyronema omphalodes]